MRKVSLELAITKSKLTTKQTTNKEQLSMNLGQQLNNKERNDEHRNDDTQSCTSHDPQGCFVDKVEVSDMSGEDDSIRATVLGKILNNT